jgi:hypothetical protein
MRHTFQQAADIAFIRQTEDSLLKQEMILVRDRYNANAVVPLGDVKGQPNIEPAVPQLIADAIDATAMQASMSKPMIHVPSLNSGAEVHNRRAARKKKAYYAAWHHSRLPLLVRRGYRHLVGYGTNNFVVLPDFERKSPVIEVRDPLTAYPDLTSAEEIRSPTNIAYIYQRSPDWIKAMYPEAKSHVDGYHSEMWDMFEWIDDSVIYIGLLGPRQTWGTHYTRVNERGSRPFQLRAWDNRAGMVPVATIGRVTLDRVAGQVSKMTGVVDMMGRLMALETIAAEKAVFPDKYVVVKDNEAFVISGGAWKDGRTGEVNVLEGADKIGQLVDPINVGTFNVLDRHERAFRMSTGQPGIFGGELTGAIRSGQTISQAGSYAVDPRVQEVQQMMEYELSVVNEAVHEVWKGYWPRGKHTVFSGWPTDPGFVEVDASDFDGKDNAVSYAFAGVDTSGQTVAIGQSVAAHLMSRKTAMVKHPLIDDPEFESEQVIVEALEEAGLTSALAQANAGTLAMIDLMNIIRHFRATHDIVKAVDLAQADAQERQATAAQAPLPGQVAAPETQPGLQVPGASGVEQPAAGPGPPGGGGAAALLAALASAPAGQ